MPSTEVERYNDVDPPTCPAAWGWEQDQPSHLVHHRVLHRRLLLLMLRGNHVGHVGDWFLIPSRS